MSIISFKHKFIFLKTKKVAGTSVESVLRGFTGEDDIVPCVTPRDEYYSAIRGDFSKNYAVRKSDEEKYTKLVLEGKFDAARDFLQGVETRYVSHMNAERLKSIVEEHGYKYEDFYKFTIERHPYNWMISGVSYNNTKYNKGTLAPLEESRIAKLVGEKIDDNNFMKNINWKMYTINDELMVDEVIKYEELNEGFIAILRKLNLSPEGIKLPDMKVNVRHLDPEKILSSEVKEKIRNRFSKVFDLLNYQ
jgi:hypothetical protein